MAGKPHRKNCGCPACLRRRVREYREKLDGMDLPIPSNPERLVAVRSYTVKAHFRKSPAYLRNAPEFRQALLEAFFKGLTKKK